MILLSTKLKFYIKGKDVFADGQKIFMNRWVEEEECHIHAHDYIEIAYVSSGTGIHIFGGRQYAVKKGDIFIINRDTPHEFRSLPGHKDKLIVYNVGFKPEFLDNVLKDSNCFTDLARLFLFSSLFEHMPLGSNLSLVGQDDLEIGELYDKMYREYNMKCFGYIELLRSYLIELIIKIFRLYAMKNIQSQQHEKIIFDRVISFMKEHYKKDIKLEDLASMSFFSRNYFCRKFKESTGMTVSEYIQKLRIEEACKLLRTTNMKIIDISSAVGYSDYKYFTRLFKKHTGKSPGEYRKAL